jgi:hypothetical protein
VKSEKQKYEGAISLSPLDISKALSGLLAIPNPEATKPKAKDKKTPATPDKE